MKKVILLAAIIATSCSKQHDVKVRILSSDVANLQQSFTLSQDGKNYPFDEAIDEELILNKGKAKYTLTTSSSQIVMTPAHVQIFQDGQMIHEVVCQPNATETGEFKLKP